MNTVEAELRKNEISVVCPIDQKNVNSIAVYVANALVSKFPNLRLNYNVITKSIASLPMYIAEMPQSVTGASYLYLNSSIYFRKGLSFENMKKLAVHECIHYFQEIKDQNGKLKRLGLCGYAGNKAYGNALNEAAVQMMAAYANNTKHENVTYYGIQFLSDSPSYYPLLCNLMKQVGYLTGFPVLFESTFYSNSAFFDKFKEKIGEKNCYKIQRSFEKILALEEKVVYCNSLIRTQDLSYRKFNSLTNTVKKLKAEIKKTFFTTQNIIITSYFDKKIKEIQTPAEIEEYRKYLYSFSNLIGKSEDYTFFNDYYIQKMSEIDAKYEAMTGNTSLQVIELNKFQAFVHVFKNLFKSNANEYEQIRIKNK